MVNKHVGANFDSYLIEGLRESDDLVFLHIKEALESPDVEVNDYKYLMKAIADVAQARGKGEFVKKSGITRQGLHKILNGESTPSIQNVMALLETIGLKFSVERIENGSSERKCAEVLDVAEYACSLLPLDATFMQLQKIVYYAQAQSLVKYDRILFKEKIEAWAAGPVVRELFVKHKGLKYIKNINLGNSENLTIEQKYCIRWSVEKYGKLDGDTLSHLTHIEVPWKSARKGIPEAKHSNKEITIKSIRDYYRKVPNYTELDESEK